MNEIILDLLKKYNITEDELLEATDSALEKTHGVDNDDLEDLFTRAVIWTLNKINNNNGT